MNNRRGPRLGKAMITTAVLLGITVLAACTGGPTTPATETPPTTSDPVDPPGTVWELVRTGGGFPDHDGNTGRFLRGVAFGDGRFVAVGGNGTVVVSPAYSP